MCRPLNRGWGPALTRHSLKSVLPRGSVAATQGGSGSPACSPTMYSTPVRPIHIAEPRVPKTSEGTQQAPLVAMLQQPSASSPHSRRPRPPNPSRGVRRGWNAARIVEVRSRAPGDVPAVPRCRGDGGGARLAPWLQGVDAALKAAEAPAASFREDMRAELVPRPAAHRYLYFKYADFAERAALLERWSRRRGQMILIPEGPPEQTVPAGCGPRQETMEKSAASRSSSLPRLLPAAHAPSGKEPSASFRQCY